jgi:DNA-binding transcriptional LysR family regulator
LQQSTRPLAWRQWFEAAGVDAPHAMAGPRYELFSMTAAAAACGLGLALVPHLLVEAEIARDELRVACHQTLPEQRAYYLVMPEGNDNPVVVQKFEDWLLQAAKTAS